MDNETKGIFVWLLHGSPVYATYRLRFIIIHSTEHQAAQVSGGAGITGDSRHVLRNGYPTTGAAV